MNALRRRYGHARYALGAGVVDAKATDALKRVTLKAKNHGDLNSAVISAGYYAKKQGKTMYVYLSNSYMHAVWRVSTNPSEYLNTINNSGEKLLSVTPDLVASWHSLAREGA